MDVINKYFDELIFKKVEQKEGYIIYAAAVNSSISNPQRDYVLVFVPIHMALKDTAHISELEWINIQTRKLKNGYRINSQTWKISKNVDMIMFKATDRNNFRTKYVAENHPLEMVLLHDPKKNSTFQFYNRMNIIGALTTFRCVISTVNQRFNVQPQLHQIQPQMPQIPQNPQIQPDMYNLDYSLPDQMEEMGYSSKNRGRSYLSVSQVTDPSFRHPMFNPEDPQEFTSQRSSEDFNVSRISLQTLPHGQMHLSRVEESGFPTNQINSSYELI